MSKKMAKLKKGDRVKDTQGNKGTVAGELRKDGYYPVRFDKHAYLRGVEQVKLRGLKKIK